MSQYLGDISAYALAVSQGYTGTEEEYAELMASYATVGQTAVTAAQTATTKASEAATSANTATNKASEATTAATTATNKAAEAQADADAAALDASQAMSAASTATTKATEATTAAATATSAKTDAVAANTAAQSAKTAAQTAQTGAETAAASVQASAAQIQTNADDISELKEDTTQLKSDLTVVNEWLGYPINLFDARLFDTTNTTNWTLEKTKTSITITHNNTFSTGFPRTGYLDLPIGDYVFHVNYNGAPQFGLYNSSGYVKTLDDGTSFTVTESNQYYIPFYTTLQSSWYISDIFIGSNSNDGVIPQLSDDINQLSETTGVLSAEVDDLQDDFDDISEPVIGELASSETIINKTINSSGALITAGTDKYKIDKYSVTGNKKYYISGSANWSNLNWCFYKSDDSVAQLGDASASGATFTTITDKEITAPASADYLLITYNTDSVVAVCKTQTGYKLNGKWTGKKWVCVGDSLTAENIRTTKHYFDYVAEETGITVVNMGDSGSGYAREQDVNTAFYQRISDCPTDADVVTIFGSFNDLGAGLEIGSVDDTGTTTLAGCINTTIDNLQAVIPLVNLGIVAPTPWDTTQPATSGQAYNYVEMLKAICGRRSIPFLDLWRSSNLRPWDADFRTLAYSKDGGSGTHPDETGHKIIAPRFKAFLETLLL